MRNKISCYAKERKEMFFLVLRFPHNEGKKSYTNQNVTGLIPVVVKESKNRNEARIQWYHLYRLSLDQDSLRICSHRLR